MNDLKQEQISGVVIYTPVFIILLVKWEEHWLGWRRGDCIDDTRALPVFPSLEKKRCEVISKRREREDERLVVFG